MTIILKSDEVYIRNGYRKGQLCSGVFRTNAVKPIIGSDGETLYIPVLDEHNVSKNIRIPTLKDCVFGYQTSKTDIPVEVRGNKSSEVTVQVDETEEDSINRIRKRFSALDLLVAGVIAGSIRALVVSGPAGVGKTYGVEHALEKNAIMYGYQYEIIKGVANALFVYQKLYEFRDKKKILVFDDCDSIFYNSDTLNLFKAALDSSDKRMITWGSDSRTLKSNDIPKSFEFQGSIIFISNMKFDKVRSEGLREHLSAIESRCHYPDLTINSQRDKFFRIKQIVQDSEILSSYGFGKEKSKDIIDFVEENIDRLRELSLRTVKKIADLALYTSNWKNLAQITCNKN